MLEVAAGVQAAIVFRIFEVSRAGLIAGTAFVSVGVIALWLFIVRAVWRKKLSLTVASVYLFAFAFPLWFARVLTPPGEPVASVFGLPLAVFHRGSETSFAILFLVTFLQLIFSSRRGSTSS